MTIRNTDQRHPDRPLREFSELTDPVRNSERISVLCVDDEQAILDLEVTMLAGEGFDIDTAHSAPEALTAFRSKQYDAVISDYEMPGQNGLELFSQLRGQTGIPLILFTGKGREDIAVTAINLGVDYYIRKNADALPQFKELSQKIREGVKRYKSEEKVKLNEEKFHAFADLTYDWEYWESSDNQYIYMSPACRRITGYLAEEFYNDPGLINRIVVAEDRRKWESHRSETELSPKMSTVEFRILTKDGIIRWINHRCHSVFDAQRNLVGRRAINIDITDRIHGQIQLMENEVRFRRLYDQAPLAYQSLDAEGKILTVNRAWLELMGYSRTEVVGQPFVNFIVHSSRKMFPEQYRYFKVQGEIHGFRIELQKKDSSGIFVEFEGRVGYDEFGNFVQTHCIFSNITERERMVRALEESESRLRSIIRVAPVGIGFVANDTLHEVNDRFCQITGYSSDELIGKSTRMLYPSADEYDNAEREMEGEVKKVGSGVVETLWRKKNGETINILLSSTPLYPADPSRGMTITALDITERKKTENSLRASEANYRQLVENANTIIMKTNTLGEITFFNEFAQNFFGYTEKEILGKRLLDTIIPHTESSTARDLEFIVRDEMEHPEKYRDHEIEHVRKNGERVWINRRSHPLFDDNGGFIGLISFGTDLTERQRAEEALSRANKKLNMLSSVTRHDILNQLTALFGYLELSKQANPDETLKGFIDRELRLTKSIRRIITFTKDYQDVGIYRPQWQGLGGLVRILAKTSIPENIRLINNLEQLEIYADPLLEKVLFTFMDNALRHGGSKLTSIRFSYRISPDGCIIICEDDGDGIRYEEKEKIFRKGYGKNTGFGLFLAREILGITGFTLQENGKPGEGARFEIAVPHGSFRAGKKE